MAVGYEKLYAYLLGQIDETLMMITMESGSTTSGILLRRIEKKLQDALWEAEDRYISNQGGQENIDFAGLYSALKEGVRTAAKEAMMAALEGNVTREALWAHFHELQSLLQETERQFQEEISR